MADKKIIVPEKKIITNASDVDEEAEKIKAKGAISKHGDIWKLGVHRLMCGDSTSEVDFAKLMNGNRAQMSVTSPPYGVGKDYESKGIEPWFDTMRPVVKNLTRYAGIVCWNLWVFGREYSTGMQAEIHEAKRLKKHIRYFTEEMEEIHEND